MPFTLAHPAIVIPFLRSRHVSATGIIAGSMIPDVEYFITMGEHCHNHHTLEAVFYSYLPLSLLLSVIVHVFIKESLIDNLPANYQQRYGAIKNFNFLRYLQKHWVIFFYSVIAGIALHMLWDSFTHGNGVFAYFTTFYSTRFVFNGRNYSMLYFLQYTSTLFGVITFVTYLLNFDAKRIVSVSKISVTYWAIMILLVIAIMGLRIRSEHGDFTHRDFLISMVSAIFIGLLITGKMDKLKTTLKRVSIRKRIPECGSVADSFNSRFI